MNIRFDNKRVIVTGAAKGFGRHIAANFVALGATVWGADIDEAELAITAKAGVTPKRCNVAKENGGSCSACSSAIAPHSAMMVQVTGVGPRTG